jgi:hypothetical protein
VDSSLWRRPTYPILYGLLSLRQEATVLEFSAKRVFDRALWFLVSRASRWGVIADDYPFPFDPHDRPPRDDPMRFLVADAEVFEQGSASDAEARDSEVGGGEFAAEVVEAAE